MEDCRRVEPLAQACREWRTRGIDELCSSQLPAYAHDALTLAAWVARLEDRWDDAVSAVGEAVSRTWRLYLSAARLGFEQGGLDVYQMLLAKPRGNQVPATRPLRPWW